MPQQPLTPAGRDALLPAIAAGDMDAFASWLREAEPRVRGSLARFARSVDTEAVLQEALLRVWQVAPRVTLDARGDSLVRLAVQIAHRLALDHVRRDRRLARAEREELLELLPTDVDDTPPPDPLLRALIASCFEKLPPQPAAALRSRLDDAGSSADETLAARLGMQLNTFLKNIGRARSFLVECLKRGGAALPFELARPGGR